MRTRCSSWILSAVTGCLVIVQATAAIAEDKQPRLSRARQAAAKGRFSEAETLLRRQIADPDSPIVDEPAVELEILRRIRLDYSLTGEQVLEQLRASIPDVTADDMESWRQQGVLQHRVIDGKVRYFDRAVSNLFRGCPAAKARCREAVTPPRTFNVPAHLAKLVSEAKQTGQTEVHPVKHRIRYTLRVKDGHPRLLKGAKVRCWLPFPQEYRQQSQVKLISSEPADADVAPRSHPQRTVYFEQVVDDPAKPPAFVAEFQFVTAAYVPQLDASKVEPYDRAGTLYQEYTAERAPHIVFTPEVQELAKEIVGEEKNPLEKVRRIFRWVSDEVRWVSEMEYSTIPNLSAKGITARAGDCGVQGLAFVTLCRAAGVPARWQSGWQTKPDRWNMHDWSEFYVEPWGWLPADASHGLQEHEDVRVREFFCGHMDPYRLIVNLDYGRELHPPKRSFRSEPNDFQRGEIEIDAHNLYFDEWEREIEIRTMPVNGGMACLEETLDAVVPKELRAGKVSGAVILVGRRTEAGYQTWEKAYGLKQREPQPALMPVDAVFDMASMTKPIATGTSMMILVEQGRVALDDPVGKYLPEFNTDEKKGVTIRHLMTHMSGMRPYLGAAQRKPIEDKAGFPCPDDIRGYIRNLPLSRKPGEVKVYSCLNAILCEEVIREVSGQTLDVFAAENVFKPLGMDESGFKPKSALCPRCVPSTREDWAENADGFLQGQVHDPLAAMQGGVSGNAGLFSTVADLSRFAQMMLNGGELDGVRVLKEQTIRDMTRIQNPGAVNTSGKPDRRGLLWDLYVPDPGDTGVDTISAYGHTGYTGTAIRFYPKQGVYVIALTNRVHPDDTSSVGGIRQAVWDAVGAVLMETPAF
jgi:CubicO group peptidase (beta-lactamase class C family)/transglutaminase-like putative cysteine protease